VPRDEPTDDGDGLGGTVPYLAAGFAALAAALVAGFVWYRRRLP
jgi:hypothetical protein